MIGLRIEGVEVSRCFGCNSIARDLKARIFIVDNHALTIITFYVEEFPKPSRKQSYARSPRPQALNPNYGSRQSKPNARIPGPRL